MHILIRTHGISLTKAMSERVRQRFAAALRHGARHLAEVMVRLKDLNGPHRGGVDKWCQVEMRFAHGAPVVIGTTDSDLYAAIDRTAHRSKQTLLERGRAVRSRRRAQARRNRLR